MRFGQRLIFSFFLAWLAIKRNLLNVFFSCLFHCKTCKQQSTFYENECVLYTKIQYLVIRSSKKTHFFDRHVHGNVNDMRPVNSENYCVNDARNDCFHFLNDLVFNPSSLVRKKKNHWLFQTVFPEGTVIDLNAVNADSTSKIAHGRMNRLYTRGKWCRKRRIANK